ncbi:MAG: hypothetical protein KAS32_18220 [Candidatus Peribacteraceae bacterium]|nr:hypothetical protein [Candidatus Peribacteraceae bacterium]
MATSKPKDQEANKEDLTKFINKGIKLVHSEGSREQVINKLGQGNPIQSVADVTVGMVQRLEQAAETGGIKLDSVTKLAGANAIMGEIIDLGVAAKAIPEMSEQERVTSFSVAVQDYVKAGIDNGSLDANALSQQATGLVEEMTPEERQQTDKVMLGINDTAVNSKGQRAEPVVQDGLLGSAQ